MPETEPRLGYSKGVLEQLQRQHEHMSREELLNLVCSLTKEYVLDKTIPFDFPLPERADELRADPPHAPQDNDRPEDPAERRFARLIEGLKQRTRLPQFDGFSVEDGKAVLIVDNQKVVFGERVTVRMTSSRRRTNRHRQTEPVAEEEQPTPESPAPARTPTATTPPPPPRAVDDDEEEDDHDAGVERFRGLDLS